MSPETPQRDTVSEVRLTVLVENSVHTSGLQAEHGWAVWLEAGSTRILFGTGQSDLVAANVARLGIHLDTAGVAAVVGLWTAFPGQCALASVGTVLEY